MTALYDAWLARQKQYKLATIREPDFYVDPNRGNNSNSGTSKAQAWQTLAKIETEAAAGNLTSKCVAIANDAVFQGVAASDRLTFSTGGSDAWNGTAGSPAILTHYDPTGDYPTDRPTWKRYWTPGTGDWVWDGTKGMYYYPHPNSRNWGHYAYVYAQAAGRFFEMCYGTTYTEPIQDFEASNYGGASPNLWVWTPGQAYNPTDYYGEIRVCDSQDACVSFAKGAGKFVLVDGLRFEECGMGVQWSNYSAAESVQGFVLQQCEAYKVGMLFSCIQDSTSSYTMTGRILENTANYTGASNYWLWCKAVEWLVAGNYSADGNNSWVNGMLYCQEGSSGATPRDSWFRENYGVRGKFNVGRIGYDGVALAYLEERARGWTLDRNWAEQSHNAFQSNSGYPVVVTRNVTNDCDKLITLSDAGGYDLTVAHIQDNTVLGSRIDAYINGGQASQAGGMIACMSNLDVAEIKLHNNSFNLAAGIEVPAVLVRNSTTVSDASGNHISAGCSAFIKRTDATTVSAGLSLQADVTFGSDAVPPATSAIVGTGASLGWRLDAAGRLRTSNTPGAFEPR